MKTMEEQTMTKIGKPKEYKISCTNCSSMFLANAEDFVMTRSVKYGGLTPMIEWPLLRSVHV